MTTSRMGRRGQITLPKEVRERLHLLEGQTIAFVIKGDNVTLQPLTTTLRDLRGFVHVEGPQDFDEVRQAVKELQANTDEALVDDA